MSRLWIRIYRDNRIMKEDRADCTTDDREDILECIKDAFAESCSRLDVENPIWLAYNRTEFIKRHKTKFRADNFIQETDYDYMELELIKEMR